MTHDYIFDQTKTVNRAVESSTLLSSLLTKSDFVHNLISNIKFEIGHFLEHSDFKNGLLERKSYAKGLFEDAALRRTPPQTPRGCR